MTVHERSHRLFGWGAQLNIPGLLAAPAPVNSIMGEGAFGFYGLVFFWRVYTLQRMTGTPVFFQESSQDFRRLSLRWLLCGLCPACQWSSPPQLSSHPERWEQV